MQLYDTATAAKRPFAPINADKVGIYACGPTVYDLAHIGNARPAVLFGLLADVLATKWTVKYVRNITDIDDKIIAAAATQNRRPSELAEEMRLEYSKDMEALGARKPDAEPLATAHIKEMQELISRLLEKGVAYGANGHIAFDIGKYPPYGGLSKRNEEATQAGARVEVADWKRDPKDFVLWKPSKANEPSWDAPPHWGVGKGRPGWHIECSAMCHHLLGDVVDIHCGGIDLLFPHHENEQAQSCVGFGTPRLANFWLHNGHITGNGKKMAKSLGNVVPVRQLLGRYHPEVIRYFLLATHYRRPSDWSEDAAAAAKNSLDSWYRLLGEGAKTAKAKPTAEFMDALYQDLNTPKALAVLHKLADQAGKGGEAAKAAWLGSANFLGLLKADPTSWFKGIGKDSGKEMSEGNIAARIEKRRLARQKGDYRLADRIRNELLLCGIVLEDTPTGSNWRKI